MKKLITVGLALLAFVVVPGVRAQTAYEIRDRELAKEADARQEELINLERDTVRAMQFNNGTLFRRVYGDDFVGVLPSGQIKDKAGWIASVENPGVKYASFIASDIRVRLFQDTAVVTCLWSSRGTRGDQSFYRQYRVTHVYVYSQHGWQVVASQETLLPG
jgi:ketosteroid isomerase-like protein